MLEVVVSVGMGPGQEMFIRRLKELGYCVASFGKGKNSNEAIKLSDFSAEIDTKDYLGAIKWLEALRVRVIAVGSFAGGAAVVTVQKLANHFHTPTAIPDSLIVSKDKIEQQRLLERFELSSIHTWKANELTPKDIEEDPNSLYIVKPAYGRGSEGIHYVDKNKLITEINGEIALGDEDIIQVAKTGIEYRCVMIVQNGELRLLAPVLRKSYKETVFLGILSYSEEHIDRLSELINKFITESGIKNSIFKADILVSDDSIDMIEMDIGVGGGSYYKRYVSELYGRDLMDEYILLITGQKVNSFLVKKPTLVMEYVFNHYLFPIAYDLPECKEEISREFGDCIIQVNRLHPENKGGFQSNADFIFSVIYEAASTDKHVIDEYVNKHLFYKKD